MISTADELQLKKDMGELKDGMGEIKMTVMELRTVLIGVQGTDCGGLVHEVREMAKKCKYHDDMLVAQGRDVAEISGIVDRKISKIGTELDEDEPIRKTSKRQKAKTYGTLAAVITGIAGIIAAVIKLNE